MKKKTEWSHLPNAVHIDRIVASVAAYPDAWIAARGAAWDAAWDAAYDAAYDAAWDAARGAAWDAARDAAYDAAYDAAWGAIAALVAWDDCSQYLSMTSEQLEIWYHLSERPACLLLLTAVRAFEQIEELELA